MAWLDRYSPKEVEQRLYQWWQDNQCFSSSSAKAFSIVLPPPNVTGSLHLGHALNHTIQDCLVRWKKMKGFQTVWFPGTDHAGIATQIQVEKQLEQKGQNRKQLGREKFLEKVWEWKHQHGGAIVEQMKRLGDACDWNRHLFTLDPSSVRAVQKAFVHFYKKGWIYRGTRLVNWSTGLSSAISDLEVEHREVQSHFYEIKYFIKDSKDFLIISTTRPETMLADQAVAVHPEDKRYKKYHGKFLKLPLTDREIPVIADSYVDPEFGTGVLKITPAHDFNDYKIGKTHQLKELNILNQEGILNEKAGIYKGLKIKEARKKIVFDLKQGGFLKDKYPHSHQVGFCSRSGSVVEPFLSQQWFMKMNHLAQRGLTAVLDGEIQLIPSTWVKTFEHWMTDTDDWCLSRQLWWGHQIPAWHCLDCSKVTVHEEKVQKCEHCSSSNIQQEEDVLDTWFSSALWPMSVLKWPDQDIRKNCFYPSSVLVTAPDILFFWVARMIMMGLEFQNQVPFKKVYLHGVVRDHQGRKMSKSLGNGEDPIDLIEEYGADALRLCLLYSHAMGRDVLFSRDTLKVCRNFMNKIWNAGRLLDSIMQSFSSVNIDDSKSVSLSTVDQWILYRLKETEVQVNQELNEFRFSSACLRVYNFAWMEFCDWYLEWIKPDIYGEDQERKKIVYFVLQNIFYHLLRLLHPFIPFITEELYQKWFVKKQKSIMLDGFPEGSEEIFFQAGVEAKEEIDFIQDMITVIRQIRGENNIKPSVRIPASIFIPERRRTQYKKIIEKHIQSILFLSKLEKLDIVNDIDKNKLNAVMSLNSKAEIKVILPLEGLVDTASERQRLEKKILKLNQERERLIQQLGVESFLANAPKKIVEEKQSRVHEIDNIMKGLQSSLDQLKKK